MLLYILIICLVSQRDLILSTFVSGLCSTPVNLPTGVSLVQTNYKNWAQQIEVNGIWTVTPKTPDSIIELANWALENGYKLRPLGFSHNWSPLVVTGDEGRCSRIILVDTKQYLTNIQMVVTADGKPTVRVQTGTSMDTLLEFLEKYGYGITGHPAPGDITIGGVIAIGGHGTGVPIEGESLNTGTVSNLVHSLDAVVWNDVEKSYEIKTFDRKTDTETRAFLVNLGRMFLTEVTIQVTKLVNLRCESRVDIPAKILFGIPKKQSKKDLTLSTFVKASGSIEAIWFPFTENPWLKVWTVAPRKPLFSRKTTHPYNYPFSDNIPVEVSNIASRILDGDWSLAPIFGNLAYGITSTGLITTLSLDLWGPSKNLLLYVKPTTLRVTANGYTLLTNRANIQSVINQFTTFYQELINTYAERKLYPINGPLEIRITGVDTEIFSGSKVPTLSSLKSVENRPDLDTAVWLDCLTFPTTPHLAEFMTEVENFILTNFSSSNVVVRPEWSKGFAYTNHSSWNNTEFLNNFIPNTFGLNDWKFTIEVFNKYDPFRIFTNKFLDGLLK